MAFEELKARQSVMWANGPYQNITETLTDLQDLTVERLGPTRGAHWLDLACGTGATAERAASAGAAVVGIDLSPGLIETAQARAKQLGLAIDYRVGDCENLDVAASNADGTGAIPMPTVVVLDADGAIRWIDVHPDFGTRTEVEDILKQVADLAN